MSAKQEFTVNVEGWKRQFSVEEIRDMFALSMKNIEWTARTPENADRAFLTDRNAVGKLSIALPLHDWSNALLPHFLKAENIMSIYGIQNIEVDTEPNENSLENHKKRYGNDWSRYYYEQDGFSFVDAFYKAEMVLGVGNTSKTLHFEKFIADYKDHFMLAEEFRQKHEGRLFETMYMFASLPEDAWKEIDKEGSNFKVGNCILRQGKKGHYFIREINGPINEREFKNREIVVRINRIGMRAINAGKLV